jgi:hypothetical protein
MIRESKTQKISKEKLPYEKEVPKEIQVQRQQNCYLVRK